MSDISPVKIDIKADLTKPANKIVDTIVAPVKGIHKGITKIISACSGKWFANRDRQVALIAAQTAKDVEDIKSGKKEYRNGELLNVALAPTMADYYRQISEHNGACDAKRLEAAMFTAAIELYNIPEEEVSDEPLNLTFFNHWRAEAELIDDEDLRQWWAHLLVEETKKPNSISPRTLDVAKNLAKDEALLFQRLLKGCFEDFILPAQDGAVTFGNYHETTIMNDAGLFYDKGRIELTWQHEDDVNGKQILLPFIDVDSVIVIETGKVQLIGNPLTRAGVELRNAIGIKRTKEDIITIADNLQMAPCGIFKIKVYDIKEKIFASDGTIEKYNWFPNPVWEKRLPNNE